MIGFSIIDPMILSRHTIVRVSLEKIMETGCRIGLIGRLGMVHQYITCMAVNMMNDKIDCDMYNYCSVKYVCAERLIAGVLYNDAGIGSSVKDGKISIEKTDENGYPIFDGCMVMIDDELVEKLDEKCDYLKKMNKVYRCYPSNWIEVTKAMVGILTSKNQASYHLSMDDKFQHIHCMRRKEDGDVKSTILEMIESAKKWYNRAVKYKDIFFIGRIFHMVQDSYSEAHTSRVTIDSPQTIYDKFVIKDIYCYEKQDKKQHTKFDSIDRIMSNPDRLNVVVSACCTILHYYIEEIVNGKEKNEELLCFLENNVFALHE